MSKRLLAILGLAMCALLSACTNTPQRGDDISNDAEEPTGPGVFSGESGVFTLFGEKDEGNAKSREPASQTSSDNASVDLDEQAEFELFKRWLAAKESGGVEYREFQHWLKFQDFKSRAKPPE